MLTPGQMFIQLKLLNYLSELLKANDNQMRLEICESLILIILKGAPSLVLHLWLCCAVLVPVPLFSSIFFFFVTRRRVVWYTSDE